MQTILGTPTGGRQPAFAGTSPLLAHTLLVSGAGMAQTGRTPTGDSLDMPKDKIILRTLIVARWTGLVLVVLCAAFYLLISWTPPSYRPPRLPQEQRYLLAKEFIGEMTAFSNAAQYNEPYEWPIQEDRLNYYLASLDDIVSFRPGHKPGEVKKVLDTAGLSEPMITLSKGTMTIMLRSHAHGKVVSADISLDMTDDGDIQIRLEGSRVGVMPIPRMLNRPRLEEFKDELKERIQRIAQDQAEGARGDKVIGIGLPSIEELLAYLIAAIDEEPLPVDRIEIGDDRYISVDDILIEPGRLLIRIVPAPDEIVGPDWPNES